MLSYFRDLAIQILAGEIEPIQLWSHAASLAQVFLDSGVSCENREDPLIILGVELQLWGRNDAMKKWNVDPRVSDLDPAMHLCEFGTVLEDRFHRTRSKEDLNIAIAAYKAAANVAFTDHGVYLISLGGALWQRFIESGSRDDLDRATVAAEAAVMCTPEEHPNRAGYLRNLITIIARKTVEYESLEVLNRTIEYAELSIKTETGGSAAVSQGRVQRPQSPEGYDGTTPDSNLSHQERFIRATLARCLLRRCHCTGRLEDVDKAILVSDSLVNYIAEDPLRASIRGQALRYRFGRAGYRKDLMNAIDSFQMAIKYARVNDPNKPGYVCEYSEALVSRFDRTGFMDDLNKAVEIVEATINSIPKDDPNQSGLLISLGEALSTRYDRTKSDEDLNNAIAVFTRAIEATPEKYSSRGEILVRLGDALKCRFALTRWQLAVDDLNNSVAAYEEAAHSKSAPQRIRICGAWRAAKLLEVRDPNKASELASFAVELLPTSSSLEWDRSLQQDTLSNFAGLAVTAASLSLTAGDGQYEALRLLELGRGVIASLQLDMRTDFTSLRTRPGFAEEQLQEVQARLAAIELDNPKSSSKAPAESPPKIPERKMLKGMRLIRPGIALLDPVIAEMMAQARLGPIVVFNVSCYRSDALIITKGDQGVFPLLLPGLHHRVLRENVVDLKEALSNLSPPTYKATKLLMKRILEWLWDVAVSPVLDKLGFQEPPENRDFPHVWWISSGLLNLLPIHAAGYHDHSNRNVLDRVISSYAPTIKCLAYSRHQAAHMSIWERGKERQQKALIVGMSNTPDQNELPYVDEEIKCLNGLFARSISRTVLQTPANPPTKADVLSQLRGSQIAHFACHGESTLTDPSQSRLFLSDWQTSPLTVADIISLKLEDPQFAYLSACHAANNRVVDLLDEGIHLAGAFQLAGFPFVVGTLWQIDDEHCVQVAKSMYTAMIGDGQIIDVTLSAPALHNAVDALRDVTRGESGGEDDPLVWATYVHMGA